MKNYRIEYTTPADISARYSTTTTAADPTTAYIDFIFAHPLGYIITDLREV